MEDINKMCKVRRETAEDEAIGALRKVVRDLRQHRGLPIQMISKLMHKLADELHGSELQHVVLHEPAAESFTPKKARSKKADVDTKIKKAKPLALIQMLRVAGLCSAQGKSEKSMSQILNIIDRKGDFFLFISA